eukprot:1355815-Amorphochlora_amoeboformis.AAC.2
MSCQRSTLQPDNHLGHRGYECFVCFSHLSQTKSIFPNSSLFGGREYHQKLQQMVISDSRHAESVRVAQ